MSEQNQAEPTQKDLDAMDVSADAIKINSVEEMGNIVVQWHFNALTNISHKLQMPPDVGIDIPTGDIDENGEEVFIDGNADHRAGFLAGMRYAAEILATFPVKGVPVDEET